MNDDGSSDNILQKNFCFSSLLCPVYLIPELDLYHHAYSYAR